MAIADETEGQQDFAEQAVDLVRECRQINLVQIIIARIWQMAR